MVGQTITCHLCNRPVDIEASGTDENGKAVHEECYVKVIRKPSRGEAESGPKAKVKKAPEPPSVA